LPEIATVINVKNDCAITKDKFVLAFITSSQIPGTQKCVRGCELSLRSHPQDSTAAPNLFSVRRFYI